MLRRCLLRAPRLAAVRRLCSSSTPPAVAPWATTAGEGGLLLRFGTKIDLALNERVLSCLATLDAGPRPTGVVEVLPAYASLLVHFDPLQVCVHCVHGVLVAPGGRW